MVTTVREVHRVGVIKPIMMGRCRGYDEETEDECSAFRLSKPDGVTWQPCWRCGNG